MLDGCVRSRANRDGNRPSFEAYKASKESLAARATSNWGLLIMRRNSGFGDVMDISRRLLSFLLLAGAGLVAGLVLLIGFGGARANGSGSDQNAAASAVPAATASRFGVFQIND